MDTNEIKKSLLNHGHKANNIWNIKHRETKNPLSLFVVELEPKENNKEIYNIKSLLHSRIVFEPPHPKRELPQCSNCQHYGHTKAYCRRSPMCIKCAGNHASVDCPRKSRSDDVKCALCEGNHPANYKGCQIYKNLQKAKFPPLRQSIPAQHTTNPPSTVSREVNDLQMRQSGISFADVLRNTQQNTSPSNQFLPQKSESTQPNLSNEMGEMMKLMREMMQQLTVVTNMFVTLMSKLPINSMN